MSYLDQYPERDNLRTGFVGNLTEQQAEALKQVLSQAELSELASDLKQFFHPERYALRFLRATMRDKTGERIFQPAPALERLLNTLKWRREKNLAQIRENILTGNLPDNYQYYCNEVRPRLVWMDPKTARPVSLEKLGVYSQYVDVDAYSMETWELFALYDLERIMISLEEQSRAVGYEVSTRVIVFDMDGMGLGAITRIKVMKVVSRIMADHYPEQSGPIFLLNAPWTFAKLFTLMEPLFDKHTRSKMCVSDKFDLELLSRVLTNVEQFLPKAYGGNNEQELKACVHAPK